VLNAIHDRVILEPIPEATETAGGILIPLAGPSKMGRVVSVGKGKLLDDGTYRPLQVKPGDRVLVNQFSELQNEDGIFWTCTEKEILGIIED